MGNSNRSICSVTVAETLYIVWKWKQPHKGRSCLDLKLFILFMTRNLLRFIFQLLEFKTSPCKCMMFQNCLISFQHTYSVGLNTFTFSSTGSQGMTRCRFFKHSHSPLRAHSFKVWIARSAWPWPIAIWKEK